MISYAQNFEDVMLARAFADKRDGFYVDVGAADPINLSVTKWFYDCGWTGLNIEPNRPLFERLIADRPRDINLDCGAGAVFSEAQFFELEVGELSSFDTTVEDTARDNGMQRATRTVQVRPLTDMLNEHSDGRSIDFLKIDVEGWELEVLKGLDLRRYRPAIILAEATVPQTRIESYAEWEPLLLAADYSFVYFDGVNRFYLAVEHADLARHFTCPPNAFDEFEPYPLLRARTDASERLEASRTLEARLIACEADRDARLAEIERLGTELATSEADRDARLATIERLGTQLATSDADRAARLVAIHQLEGLLAESESDRAARLTAIEGLQRLLAAAQTK